MASDAVKEFNDDNFDTEVLQAGGAVLVDFWAPWCGPCRQIAPMIDELATENPSIKIGKGQHRRQPRRGPAIRHQQHPHVACLQRWRNRRELRRCSSQVGPATGA